VQECASIYPEAGHILTRASVFQFPFLTEIAISKSVLILMSFVSQLNTILAADEKINKLILHCLMEYSKLWDAPDSSLDHQDASKLWCLTHIRCLMHRSRTTNLALDQLVEKITKSAQSRLLSLGVCIFKMVNHAYLNY
jgi:hypothetical protein